MKRKLVGIFVVTLVMATAALPVVGTMNKGTVEMEKKTVEIHDNAETLIHPELAFLFGRINNKHRSNSGWACNAVNLRIIEIVGLDFYQYTSVESILVGRLGLGIFTNRFICGFYMYMY